MLINKLVRDNIPDKIKDSGKIPIYQLINNKDEFIRLLKNKLQEEVTEYLESNDVIELCDIIEVVYALIDIHGVYQMDFENLRKNKSNSNGVFKRQVFLSDIVDK